MTTHQLKIEPEYMKQQLSGVKNFEIRKNDRDYKIGDKLVLQEWNGFRYTGKETNVCVTSVCDYGQKKGWVVLGTQSLDEVTFRYSHHDLRSLFKSLIESKKYLREYQHVTYDEGYKSTCIGEAAFDLEILQAVMEKSARGGVGKDEA